VYPNPKTYALRGTDTTLDHLTVRHLTRALTPIIPPACEARWDDVLGITLPWGQVWRAMSRQTLLTPPDKINAFKLCHREIWTRHRFYHTGINLPSSVRCRLCQARTEDTRHLLSCSTIKSIMGAVMQEISPHTPLTEPFMLCAAIPALGGGLTLAPPGIVAAHQVTWKFVYSSFIKADLLDEPFVSRDVINSINSTGCESACKVTYSEPN